MLLLCKMAPPVIMEYLLGLLFFSLLSMTATSLECESCTADSTTCSGKRQACLPSQDVCISAVTEVIAAEKVTQIIATKACSTSSACGLFRRGFKGWVREYGHVVINAQCSKALAASGSFLLTVLGLLLPKLLF